MWQAPGVIVDHQVHWLPPACLEALVGRSLLPRAERSGRDWVLALTEHGALPATPEHTDLGALLALASSLGIDVLVVSSPPLSECLHLDGAEAADLLRGVNAAIAAAQRAHPDRIVGLAALPLQDADEALSVLEDAAAAGLRGVLMLSSIEGRPIATDETRPVFRRIDELGLPVVLHPAVRSAAVVGGGVLTPAEGGIGWMADTSRAAFDLIESGILDECPRLQVLHPHLGGVLPYVLGRLERIQGERRPIPVAEYLRTRFYTDTVSRTPGAVALALRAYGRDRVLFGSDNPFEQMAWMKQFVIDEGMAGTVFANVMPGLLPP